MGLTSKWVQPVLYDDDIHYRDLLTLEIRTKCCRHQKACKAFETMSADIAWLIKRPEREAAIRELLDWPEYVEKM